MAGSFPTDTQSAAQFAAGSNAVAAQGTPAAASNAESFNNQVNQLLTAIQTRQFNSNDGQGWVPKAQAAGYSPEAIAAVRQKFNSKQASVGGAGLNAAATPQSAAEKAALAAGGQRLATGAGLNVQQQAAVNGNVQAYDGTTPSGNAGSAMSDQLNVTQQPIQPGTPENQTDPMLAQLPTEGIVHGQIQTAAGGNYKFDPKSKTWANARAGKKAQGSVGRFFGRLGSIFSDEELKDLNYFSDEDLKNIATARPVKPAHSAIKAAIQDRM